MTEIQEITEEDLLERAFVEEVETIEKMGTDCPAGMFKLRLIGNYGMQKGNDETSKSRAHNLRFAAVAEQKYDPETRLQNGEPVELKVPHRFYQKFWTTKRTGERNDFAIQRANSWFHAVGYDTRGELDPKDKKYKFNRDEAFTATLDREAWARVTLKKDETYGWQVEVSDFSAEPWYRLPEDKPTNGHG